MQTPEPQNETLIERRGQAPEQSIWWDKLSLAQKFSASSLGKFGYELAFVRSRGNSRLAVLKCSDGLVIITEDGDINTSPDIKIR